MALLKFKRQSDVPLVSGAMCALLQDYSIEVMPRTAANVVDFRALLPPGTRVYIAHIDGTSVDDMVATAARLRAEGFEPMPHIPARLIRDRQMLADLISRYQAEAGVTQALVLAGGVARQVGPFASSMDLLATGLFDGFTRLHVAGHPEGNRDIDPDGGDAAVIAALRWKQDFACRTGVDMAIVTQFVFEAAPVIDWTNRLVAQGITLPVHLGVAGPAKLQTLLKFAIACGVGPSIRVLQKRAKDVTKLLTPFEPTQLVRDLAAHQAQHPDFAVQTLHFFPLGGIIPNAQWAADHGAPPAANR